MTNDLAAQRAALMAEIDAGFTRFDAYLDTLAPSQWTAPLDAAGWSAKDHVMHLAVWAGSMIAVMDGRPRWEAMGVSPEVWATITDTYDVINDDIRRQHADASPAAVRTAFTTTHRALNARAAALGDEDLVRPYHHFQPWATGVDGPLHAYLRGNTVEHYDEHRGYVEALLGGR